MARASMTPFRAGGLIGGADPFLSLHREMNRLFDDALRGSGPATAGGEGTGTDGSLIAPRMNVSETEGEIRVTAELPGVTENDVHVELNDDLLTIRGEKRVERKQERENFHFVERSFGTFQRSLQLPFPLDPEQVQARFENGVLTVTLPKAAQQQRSHRIQVQSGASQQQGSLQGTGGEGGQMSQPDPSMQAGMASSGSDEAESNRTRASRAS